VSRKLLKLRSKFEGTIVAELKKRKIRFTYEPDKLDFFSDVRGGRCPACGHKPVQKKRYYVPDFRIKQYKKATDFGVFETFTVYIEGKGKLTPSERTKLLDIRKHNPLADIKIVFMRDNKLSRNSTTRYSEWATANGFPNCVGPENMPKEWFK